MPAKLFQSCLSDSVRPPWTIVHQPPLSTGFSRQDQWSGLPRPPPGDLPDPGIAPMHLNLLHYHSFITSAAWEALPPTPRALEDL